MRRKANFVAVLRYCQLRSSRQRKKYQRAILALAIRPRKEQYPMPLKPSEKIWHNGKMIPWADAQIHVISHVTNYGSSVFEGIRYYDTPPGPAIFRLRD